MKGPYRKRRPSMADMHDMSTETAEASMLTRSGSSSFSQQDIDTLEHINMKTAMRFIGFLAVCDVVTMESLSMVGKIRGFREISPTVDAQRLQKHANNIAVCLVMLKDLGVEISKKVALQQCPCDDWEERLKIAIAKAKRNKVDFSFHRREAVVAEGRQQHRSELLVVASMLIAPITYTLCCFRVWGRVFSLEDRDAERRRELAEWACQLWIAAAILAIVNALIISCVATNRDFLFVLGAVNNDVNIMEAAKGLKHASDISSFFRQIKDSADISDHVQDFFIFVHFFLFVWAKDASAKFVEGIDPLIMKVNMVGQWGDQYWCAQWLESLDTNPMTMYFVTTIATSLLYLLPRRGQALLWFIVPIYFELLGLFVTVFTTMRTYACMVLAAKRSPVGGVVGAVPGLCAFFRNKLAESQILHTSSPLIEAMRKWHKMTQRMKACYEMIDLEIYQPSAYLDIKECPATYRSWDENFVFPIGDYAFARSIFCLHDDDNRAIDTELLYESTLATKECNVFCEKLWKQFDSYDKKQVHHAYRTLFFNLKGRENSVQVRSVRPHIRQKVSKGHHLFHEDYQRDGTIWEVLDTLERLDELKWERNLREDPTAK